MKDYETLSQNGPTETDKNTRDIVASYIDSIVKTCTDIAFDVMGRKQEFTLEYEVRCEASFYFDFCNESVAIVTDDRKYTRLLDGYIIVDGKRLKTDPKAVCDFVAARTTFGAICADRKSMRDVECIAERVIEQSVHDAAERYKVRENGMFCLLPDALDDFNRDIRNQFNYNGKRLFCVPRSVALLMGLQKHGALPENGEIYVIDFDGNEPSVISLKTRREEGYDKPVIIRKGLRRISYETIGYSDFSRLYVMQYCKKHGLTIGEDIQEGLCKSKAVQRLLMQKQEIFTESNGSYIKISYDGEIHAKLNDALKNDFEKITKELPPVSSVYAICSYSDSSWCVGESALFEGCAEVERRLKEKERLWEEYLPQLSLEVIDGGTYRELELIKRDEFRDVLKVMNEEEVIPVNGTVVLSKGKNFYTLPLEREIIGSINKDKIACLKHKSFPLDESVKVRMEIHYKYGDEDSYKLYFYALDKNAPFERIENEWEDIEPIEHISVPDFESEPQPLSDLDAEEISRGVSESDERLDKILSGYWSVSRCRIRQNKVRGMFESDIFFLLNRNYRGRRKFFSVDSARKTVVKEAMEQIFTPKGLLDKMLGILTESTWKTILTAEIQMECNDGKLRKLNPFNVVKENTERILADFAILYAGKARTDDRAAVVERIITYYFNQNKLRYLSAISRCVKTDRHGIFDSLNRKLLNKIENDNLDVFDLRNLSSNCWQCNEWIANVYKAENGGEVIKKLTDESMKWIESFKERDIRPDFNPRPIRDIFELLLCLTRADEFFRNDGQKLIDPNEKRTKDLIVKIKTIDRLMSENSGTLKFDFTSRLNAKIDRGDLYNVNEISYMLIQTLSGRENIKLIGFEED